MKKYFKIVLVCMIVTLLTGCLGREKVTTCTLKSDQSSSGYNINSEYKIYSSKNSVNKVVTVETVESKNNTILSYFEKQLKNQYKSFNDIYGGYSYKITNKDNKVVSEVTIDYNKMNMKSFIKNNPSMKPYVDKSNKISLNGLKTMYKSIGASCGK